MFRKLMERGTSYGVRKAAKALWWELRIQKWDRTDRRRVKQFLNGGEIKLNLGSGPNRKNGWVNIDLGADADLNLDLRERFPFDDGSVSVIYSEHFFEHLEYPDEVGRVLGESLRVLRPGGLFSVGVPDTAWPVTAYVTGDEEYFRSARAHRHRYPCTTRMHDLNYHFRQGSEHKYSYDEETLAEVLRNAGFVSVAARQWDPAMDAPERRLGTLYMDGRKPPAQTA
ncbi:MAG: class I SAM-dependent methyltransferase [Gemmatimonadaceae bacterium]